MRYVEPKVFRIAETQTIYSGVKNMLAHLGAPDWQSDAVSGGEELAEIAGRLCYKSFAPGLNANVTKVREGNYDYIGNILKQHHGSVIEHPTVTFAFLDVSRIETHEKVRHRVGTAFSQESGRYVRLDEFLMYKPEAIEEVDPDVQSALDDLMELTEERLTEIMGQIPWDTMDFHQKKRVTSALRRYAPQGQVTNIIVTANHRAWRHMIEQRTSDGAEEEIRKIFDLVAGELVDNYPAIYQDMKHPPSGNMWSFKHSKV